MLLDAGGDQEKTARRLTFRTCTDVKRIPKSTANGSTKAERVSSKRQEHSTTQMLLGDSAIFVLTRLVDSPLTM